MACLDCKRVRSDHEVALRSDDGFFLTAARRFGRAELGVGARRDKRGEQGNAADQTMTGTISSATMLMILISGFTAGPAVSL